MTREELEKWAEDAEESILFADGFDSAIVGLGEQYSRTTAVVYDYDKCVDVLVKRDGMTEEEAIEYIEFNTAQAYVGESTPIFLRTTL